MYKTPENWQQAIDRGLPGPGILAVQQTDLIILGVLRMFTLRQGSATVEELEEAIGHPTISAEVKTALQRLTYLGLVEWATAERTV